MKRLWFKNGRPVVGPDGAPVWCECCPCPPDCTALPETVCLAAWLYPGLYVLRVPTVLTKTIEEDGTCYWSRAGGVSAHAWDSVAGDWEEEPTLYPLRVRWVQANCSFQVDVDGLDIIPAHPEPLKTPVGYYAIAGFPPIPSATVVATCDCPDMPALLLSNLKSWWYLYNAPYCASFNFGTEVRQVDAEVELVYAGSYLGVCQWEATVEMEYRTASGGSWGAWGPSVSVDVTVYYDSSTGEYSIYAIPFGWGGPDTAPGPLPVDFGAESDCGGEFGGDPSEPSTGKYGASATVGLPP